MTGNRFRVGDQVRVIEKPRFNGTLDVTARAVVGNVYSVTQPTHDRKFRTPHVVVQGHWIEEACLEPAVPDPSPAELMATFASIGGESVVLQVAAGALDDQLHDINLAVAKRLLELKGES